MSPGDEFDDEDGENWSMAWHDDADDGNDDENQHAKTTPSTDTYNNMSSRATEDVSWKPMSSDREAKSKTDDTKCTNDETTSGATIMSRMAINDNKAGMQGLDREKINKIIYEASKGSRFYENELKKEEQMNKRIQEQQARRDKLTDTDIAEGDVQADILLQELETTREFSRSIVHTDMDAFYAAVEMRDNPSLRDKPMAVGGIGMLSTSNYLARRYGVRAAMPGFIGKKLCPDLIIVPTNFTAYRAASNEVREIFQDYDPNFCPMSLDEAYLDFTHHIEQRQDFSEQKRTFPHNKEPEMLCHCMIDRPGVDTEEPTGETVSAAESIADTSVKHHESRAPVSKRDTKETASFSRSQLDQLAQGSSLTHADPIEPKVTSVQPCVCPACGKPTRTEDLQKMETFGKTLEEAVREMRFRIQQKTRLTASAGIAPNTMLAKVCSDRNKPNGQYRVLPSRNVVMDFIRDLPIRKISGIGKVSEKMLRALNITTCQHLYENRGLLYHLYSTTSFNYFMRISLGIASTRVERDGERKSMSTERTFRELSSPADLYKKCYELCQSLSEDLQEADLVGKTVTLKIKLVTFETRTRAHTLINYTQGTEQIYTAARDLLKTEIQSCNPQPLKLRLMGVRMSNMVLQSQLGDQKQGTITGLFKKLKSKQTEEQPVCPSEDIKTDRSESAESVEERPLYTCPVCGRSLLTLDSANRHIDQCLTRQEEHKEHKTNSFAFPGKRPGGSSSTIPEKAGPSGRQIERESATATLEDIPNDILLVSTDNRSNSEHACSSDGPLLDAAKAFDSSCASFQQTPSTQSRVESGSTAYNCPVCGQEQQSCNTLDSFNQHVDACLNRQTIKQIVQQQNKEMKPERNTQKRFGSNQSSQTTKKRKTSNVRTLDSFLK